MFRIIRDIHVRAYHKRQLTKQFRESLTPVSTAERFNAAYEATCLRFNIRLWEAEQIISNGR
jgi:hypothetical protein